MFTIVIIDDEPLSIRKLELLLSRSQLPVQVLGTASDGEEGLKLIHKHKPNLIFTDIQMPKMDGLEMIRQLRKEKIDTTITILSCHENFFYAKEALKLNTYDYLIKDLLNLNSLNALFARLMTDHPDFVSEKKLSNIADKAQILSIALKKATSESLLALKKNMPEKSLSSRYVLIYIKLSFSSPFFNTTVSSEELDKLLEMIHCNLPASSFQTLFNQDMILLNTIPCGPSRLNYYTECQKLSQQLIKVLHEHYHSIFMITISEPFSELEDMSLHYDKVVECSQNLLPSKMHPTFYVNDHHYTPSMTYEIIDLNLSSITEMVEQQDMAGIRRTVHTLFNDQENGFIQLNYLNYLHLCLLSCLRQTMATHHINAESIFGHDHIPLEELEQLEYLNDIEAWYSEKLEIIVQKLADKINKNYSPKINQSIQLIDENPSISLTELSAALDINKSYLCRLFKKEMSMNLTDYTLCVRIEKAKKLLAKTQMKINDISESLGYIYPHQFSKDFKKATGEIPTEFRRKHTI